MDLFLTDTLMRLLDRLRAAGYLEATTAGFAAIAFGVGYLLIHRRIATSEPVDFPRLARLAMRVGLGGIFLVMGGVNGLFQLVPDHPSSMREPCAACAQFLQGILSTGYLFPLLKGVELVAGALLLCSRWVPLALVALAPIVLNIFLYHLALDPRGLPLAVLIVLLELGLAWQYRSVFLPLFVARPVLPAGRPG